MHNLSHSISALSPLPLLILPMVVVHSFTAESESTHITLSTLVFIHNNAHIGIDVYIKCVRSHITTLWINSWGFKLIREDSFLTAFSSKPIFLLLFFFSFSSLPFPSLPFSSLPSYSILFYPIPFHFFLSSHDLPILLLSLTPLSLISLAFTEFLLLPLLPYSPFHIFA